MGLVNKIRGALGGSADEPDEQYVCGICGAEFDSHRTTCEKCGSMDVNPA